MDKETGLNPSFPKCQWGWIWKHIASPIDTPTDPVTIKFNPGMNRVMN